MRNYNQFSKTKHLMGLGPSSDYALIRKGHKVEFYTARSLTWELALLWFNANVFILQSKGPLGLMPTSAWDLAGGRA